MFRYLLVVLFGLIISVSSIAETINIGIHEDEILMGKEKKGETSSWIMEELNNWGKLHGHNINFIVEEWSSLEDRFKAGEIQAIYPANKIEEREKYMDFTDAVYKEIFYVISLDNTKVILLNEIKDKRVGTIDSTLLKGELGGFFPTIKYYQNSDELLDALHNDEIEYSIINERVVNRNPDSVIVIGELWFENEGRIGVQKNNKDIIDNLERYFFTKDSNTTRQRIRDKIEKEKLNVIKRSLNERLKTKESVELDIILHKEGFPFIEVVNGSLKSPLIDVMNQFNELSQNIQFNIMPMEEHGVYNDDLVRLTNGNIDAMAPIGKSPKRDARYNKISSNYIIDEDSVMVFSHRLAPEISTIYEIKTNIGVLDSHMLEDIAYSNLPKRRIKIYSNREEALDDLNNREIDYLLDTRNIVEAMSSLKNYNNIKQLFPLTSFSYTIYLSPTIDQSVVDDISLVFKAIENITKIHGGYRKSVTPMFAQRYLAQIKIAFAIIVVLICIFIRRHSQEKGKNEQMIKALVGSLESVNYVNNEETGDHVTRIGLYSEVLAREIGLNKKKVEDIKLFAPLHDVGKVGIPPHILTKPGRLTEDERKIMMTHTEMGRDIVSKLKGIPSEENLAVNIVLYHHEKWNGTGYPKGLKEENIPIEARIVALSDVYDALRMPRVYKEGLSHAKTSEIIIGESGKHFDPKLVQLFKENEEEFDHIYTTNSPDEQ